jgi:hypothetical protein
MPTNRKRRSRASNALDHWKIDQLATGDSLIAGVGYSKPKWGGCNHWTEDQWAEFREAMRADWAIYGEDVSAWWRGEHDRYTDRFTSREKLRGRGITELWAAAEFDHG